MMKNKSLILIILGIILSSCATTNRYASSTFEDAIYQTPGSVDNIVVNTDVSRELEALRGKTRESNSVIIDGRVVEGVYADEYGNVDIDAGEDKTYIILNPGETFEERLTKFDDPSYTININYDVWDLHNPWLWDIYYNPYGYGSGYYWRSSWYNAWSPYNWHSRWDYHRYSPFYSWNSFYWGMPYYPYTAFYDPWYYYNSGYAWGHYSPSYPSYGSRSRDRYYGRRVSGSSYSQTDRSAISGGSLIRREGVRTSQVRGTSTQISSEALNTRYSESTYRRENRSSVSTSRETVRQSTRTTRQSSGVLRQSTGTTRQSTGTVRQSTGTTRQSSSTVRRTSGSVRQSSGNVRQSSQYRQPTTRTSTGSSVQRSSTTRTNSGRSTYERSTPPARSTYTPPPASSRSGSTTRSTGSTSSSTSRSSSSSSSGRRR